MSYEVREVASGVKSGIEPVGCKRGWAGGGGQNVVISAGCPPRPPPIRSIAHGALGNLLLTHVGHQNIKSSPAEEHLDCSIND